MEALAVLLSSAGFQRLMVGRCHGNITPVPTDVTDAVDNELAEEWMMMLADFVGKQLQPVSKAGEASTAASIRESFSRYAGVPKKEAGLKLARKGFMKDSNTFRTLHNRTSRRVYKVRCPDGSTPMARLVSDTVGQGFTCQATYKDSNGRRACVSSSVDVVGAPEIKQEWVQARCIRRMEWR